jgi:glycosyltransferase involved in cell wall biosynthesis
VIGDGELRNALESLATELGIAGRVHFTGWILNVAEVMSDADVVVLASRNEGTPVSLIEAAAAGTPVVATDVGGVSSVVEHGRTGLLVRPGDSSALAAAISRLVADPATAREFGVEARQVAQRFSAERLVADIRSIYAELLQH